MSPNRRQIRKPLGVLTEGLTRLPPPGAGLACGELFENELDSKTRSADQGFSSQDLGCNGIALKMRIEIRLSGRGEGSLTCPSRKFEKFTDFRDSDGTHLS